MSSGGFVILLIALSFFVIVGISATSNLVDEANTSNDSNISQAAQGASSTMSPLWVIMGFSIVIIGIYALIHAYSKM
jgi:amino acid transporter